jgi:hypothetical protein
VKIREEINNVGRRGGGEVVEKDVVVIQTVLPVFPE